MKKLIVLISLLCIASCADFKSAAPPLLTGAQAFIIAALDNSHASEQVKQHGQLALTLLNALNEAVEAEDAQRIGMIAPCLKAVLDQLANDVPDVESFHHTIVGAAALLGEFGGTCGSPIGQ